VLGGATDALVAMEATGHYWKNLFAALGAAGFAVALLNPLLTRRFAGEDPRERGTSFRTVRAAFYLSIACAASLTEE
jgi:transposase